MKRSIQILPAAVNQFLQLQCFSRYVDSNNRTELLKLHLKSIKWKLLNDGANWQSSIPIQSMPKLFRIAVYTNVVMTIHVKRSGYGIWQKEVITILKFNDESTNESTQ